MPASKLPCEGVWATEFVWLSPILKDPCEGVKLVGFVCTMPVTKPLCEGVSVVDIDCAKEPDIEKITAIQIVKYFQFKDLTNP